MDVRPVLSDIEDKLTQISDTLLAGRAPSYEEYKHLVGQYRGLVVARNSILDRAKQQEIDDDQ